MFSMSRRLRCTCSCYTADRRRSGYRSRLFLHRISASCDLSACVDVRFRSIRTSRSFSRGHDDAVPSVVLSVSSLPHVENIPAHARRLWRRRALRVMLEVLVCEQLCLLRDVLDRVRLERIETKTNRDPAHRFVQVVQHPHCLFAARPAVFHRAPPFEI